MASRMHCQPVARCANFSEAFFFGKCMYFFIMSHYHFDLFGIDLNLLRLLCRVLFSSSGTAKVVALSSCSHRSIVWSPPTLLHSQIMASALLGGSPRKLSFNKQKSVAVTPLVLQITPNVTADIGSISLQNGYVSALSSASQLQERNPTQDTAMYFLGPFCKQSPPDWVRTFYDKAPPHTFLQYLRPSAAENTTHIAFNLTSGQSLEADGTWALHVATNNLGNLRQCFEILKDMLMSKLDFQFPSGRAHVCL